MEIIKKSFLKTKKYLEIFRLFKLKKDLEISRFLKIKKDLEIF